MTRVLLTMVIVLTLAPFAGGCLGTSPEQKARNALPGGGEHGGPEHRPGQPCLLCHTGRFVVAGTVYAHATDAAGMPSAAVHIEDAAQPPHSFTVHTNGAGNFMVEARGGGTVASEQDRGRVDVPWTLVFPLRVDVTAPAATARTPMRSFIEREGSCAGCHTATAGPASPGKVFAIPEAP